MVFACSLIFGLILFALNELIFSLSKSLILVQTRKFDYVFSMLVFKETLSISFFSGNDSIFEEKYCY